MDGILSGAGVGSFGELVGRVCIRAGALMFVCVCVHVCVCMCVCVYIYI